MSRRPDYSIIVPFHSNEQLLRICLKTLLKTVPDEVEKIVVWNNWREMKLPWLTKLAQFRIVRRYDDLGYSRAINIGTEEARGKVLIFCDADTFYIAPWFEHLTRFYSSMPNIGIASSRLLDPRTNRVLDFGIGFTKYNAPHPQRDLRHDDAAVRGSRQVQAACSASMIIDAQLFAQIGKFDEALINGYSDLDLCLRLGAIGRSCWVLSASTAYHYANSAHLSRHSYIADIKALFAAKNSSRIQTDMHGYYQQSFLSFQNVHKLSSAYLVIDLSTVADHAWHLELLRQYVNIVSIYEYPASHRDSQEVSLLTHLGFNIVDARISVLYFVDRFIALRSNWLWQEMRRKKDDLVVDRNANVMLLSEIVHEEH